MAQDEDASLPFAIATIDIVESTARLPDPLLHHQHPPTSPPITPTPPLLALVVPQPLTQVLTSIHEQVHLIEEKVLA